MPSQNFIKAHVINLNSILRCTAVKQTGRKACYWCTTAECRAAVWKPDHTWDQHVVVLATSSFSPTGALLCSCADKHHNGTSCENSCPRKWYWRQSASITIWNHHIERKSSIVNIVCSICVNTVWPAGKTVPRGEELTKTRKSRWMNHLTITFKLVSSKQVCLVFLLTETCKSQSRVKANPA